MKVFQLFSRFLVLATLGLTAVPLASFGYKLPKPEPHFEFRSNDVVALIGDTLIEREQSYGYVEERLVTSHPEMNLRFRNLGWSGDTPTGISRTSFDFEKAGRGLELIKSEISNVQPSVVIIGYGMASSFDGTAGVPKFKAAMESLIDTIKKACTNGAPRLVFLSPISHEKLPAPLPDPKLHNQELALYAEAIEQIAAAHKDVYISLLAKLSPADEQTQRLSDDGIHLTDFGYLKLAEVLATALKFEPNAAQIEITKNGEVTPGSFGMTVSGLKRTAEVVEFTATDAQLVSPNELADGETVTNAATSPKLRVKGLKHGHYELSIDGKPVALGDAGDWSHGMTWQTGPQFNQAEELRKTILLKNQLYFDRWRPQNETYLFGFRKSEQGQNAKEIPMFDPLIVAQEKLIATLSRPVAHTFALTKVADAEVLHATNGENVKASVGDAAAFKPQPVPEFDVAPGFTVNLYAESPLLAKPIQMNFDPQGRLWVVSSSVYPQVEPGQKPDDKVLILEDTTGTGQADKSTVFVDGLMIPTGLEPGDGGVYVSQGTQLLHFKDAHGSGKADEKRIVLSGFGTEDTHHLLHTLHWGMDGRLYFDQSIYIHSHIETPEGVERLNSGGIWRFRPDSMNLEVYLRGFCNPWGHQFDEFGESFVTDGAGNQGISLGIQGATYFTYANIRRELKSISPGNYPKFCGLEIIESKQFPSDWQGNMITCDFRAHRVVRFAVDEKGSGYETREMPDLLRSTNVTFRPIDVKLGPDGALYIADWSNPIIQHGEVDFRDPRRDHEHGRIWRIVANDRPLNAKPQLISASNNELFNELCSSNIYNQQQARRVLTERGVAIKHDLDKWAKAQKDERAMLEALWMFQAIDVVEPALLDRTLNAKDGHVRAAATRVAGYWAGQLKDPLALIKPRIEDSFPRVRIEALRALSRIPSTEAVTLALDSLAKANDPFLDYTLWLTINDLAQPWVAAVQSHQWNPIGREKQLEYGLKAIQPEYAAAILSQVLKNREIPKDGSGPWIELIGTAGSAAELQRLYQQVLDGGFDDAATVRALKSLTTAAQLRPTLNPTNSATVDRVLASTNNAIRLQAAQLAGAWKTESALPQLFAILKQNPGDTNSSHIILESVRQIGGNSAEKSLVNFINEKPNRVQQRQAVLALAALSSSRATQPMLDALNGLQNDAEATEFWRGVLSIKSSSKILVKNLPKSGLSPVMAKAGIRVAGEDGQDESELILALSRGADLESEGFGLTDSEMKQLAERAMKTGNAARGETIFRRKDIGCVNCHAIGGVGGKVGPDLTSIGASAQVDYLVESVFYPNRKIKEGYHSLIVETKDGEQYSGIPVRENGEELVLRNTGNQEITIAKSDIKTRTIGNSLMPMGLVDSLNGDQQSDLFRFLAELGKPGPYDASKGNVARLWHLFPQTVEANQFGDDKVLKGKLTDAGWQTVFSLVNGEVVKQELQGALKPVAMRDPKFLYGAAQVQTSGGEPFGFRLSAGAAKPQIWIDGQLVASSPANNGFVKSAVAAGTHTIVVKLPVDHLPDYLKLEVEGGTFLAN